jgi:hypothetical protein
MTMVPKANYVMPSHSHAAPGVDGPICALTRQAHCRGMMHFSEPIPHSSTSDALAGHVRLAAAAYLGRFKGSSREHTESDLRCYLTWCAERGLDPLAARRADLELCIRWVQELRRFRPSTVSRRPPGSTGPV